MDEIGKAFVVVVLVIMVVLGYCALLAIPTWLLWNWLMPIISNGAIAEISLVQALGLNILCNILFKSSQTCNQS